MIIFKKNISFSIIIPNHIYSSPIIYQGLPIYISRLAYLYIMAYLLFTQAYLSYTKASLSIYQGLPIIYQGLPIYILRIAYQISRLAYNLPRLANYLFRYAHLYIQACVAIANLGLNILKHDKKHKNKPIFFVFNRKKGRKAYFLHVFMPQCHARGLKNLKNFYYCRFEVFCR